MQKGPGTTDEISSEKIHPAERNREYIAKTRIGIATKDFQNALKTFEDTLDRAFPNWKVLGFSRASFGDQPVAKLDESIRLSLSDIQENIARQGKALKEQHTALQDLNHDPVWNKAGPAFGVQSEALSHLSPDEIRLYAKKRGKALQDQSTALQDFEQMFNISKSKYNKKQDILFYIENKHNTLKSKRDALFSSIDAIVIYSQCLAESKEKQKKLDNEIKVYKKVINNKLPHSRL